MKASITPIGPLLSVRERVQAVMALRREEGTLAGLSVSELCRLAAVNRASLYAHHRDLIRQVRASRGRENEARRATAPRPEVKQRHELSAARLQIRALLLTVAELQLEAAMLQRRLLGDPRAPRKSAQRKAAKAR